MNQEDAPERLQRLLELVGTLRQTSYRLQEEGVYGPPPSIHGIPRDVFDLIPSREVVDDTGPDNPNWVKRYEGFAYYCWTAPEVSL